MKKEPLSFSDVEQLLSELAQYDRRVSRQDEAQTELMRGAARREIRRVFLRRRCLRLAGSAAMLALLGGSFALLQPEERRETPAMATALPGVKEKVSRRAVSRHAAPEAPPIPISYSTTIGGPEQACEVVIYAVPL